MQSTHHWSRTPCVAPFTFLLLLLFLLCQTWGSFLSLVYQREGSDAYYRDALHDALAALNTKQTFSTTLSNSAGLYHSSSSYYYYYHHHPALFPLFFFLRILLTIIMSPPPAPPPPGMVHGSLLVIRSQLETFNGVGKLFKTEDYEGICDKVKTT